MIITVLDMNFNAVAIVEAYRSFIWTDRYDDVGDFELYVPASAPYLDKIRNDFYISCTEADYTGFRRLMIVEKKEYKTDLENGNNVVISGRSLESILDRRIVWKKDGSITEINRKTIHDKIPSITYDDYDTTKEFPLQNGIQYLLEMNVINPTNDPLRKINSFSFENSTDSRITSLTLRPCSYRGDSLYNVIRSICDMYGISFQIVFDESISKFKFKLYKGISHLSSQTENGYVCFSAEFDNLLSSDNSIDMSTYRTMAYFIGNREKWTVKEFSETEIVETGYIRVYNNALYACISDEAGKVVPKTHVPPDDTTTWALVTSWNLQTAYTVGSYVTYDLEIYRIDHDVVRYTSGHTYSEGAVVLNGTEENSWMYISLVSNNNQPLPSPSSEYPHGQTNEYWYVCKDENECFNAQDWDQIQSIGKETEEIIGNVQNNSTSDMDRRELFVDATNVPSSYTYYPDPYVNNSRDYILDKGIFEATLRDKALSELTIPNCRPTKNFDCEIETLVGFKYRRDYNIGDIIEVKDAFGFIDSVVVNSYVISHDESGIFKAYPTFESVEASTIVTRYLELNDDLSTGTFLLKIPESTRFNDKQIIATSKKNNTTYYLMSFVKKIRSDSEFTDGQVDREMHMVAWCTDTTVYTDGRYQTQEQAMTIGPSIVGQPMFYIDIEGNIELPAIVNPSWEPPVNVNLGVINEVHPDKDQYKNILLANL